MSKDFALILAEAAANSSIYAGDGTRGGR